MKRWFISRSSPKIVHLNTWRLKEAGLVQDTWFSNAAIRVKAIDEKIHKMSPMKNDLIKIAPDYEDFSFGGRVLFDNPEFMDIVSMDRLNGVSRKDSNFDPEEIADRVRPLNIDGSV